MELTGVDDDIPCGECWCKHVVLCNEEQSMYTVDNLVDANAFQVYFLVFDDDCRFQAFGPWAQVDEPFFKQFVQCVFQVNLLRYDVLIEVQVLDALVLIRIRCLQEPENSMIVELLGIIFDLVDE